MPQTKAKLPFALVIVTILMVHGPGVVFADEAQTKTLVWEDGTRYVGGVLDGKRSGKGTIFWTDGTRFIGTFYNDLKNGPGTMILPNGTVYDGYFKDDSLVRAPVATDDPFVAVAIMEQNAIQDKMVQQSNDRERSAVGQQIPPETQVTTTPKQISQATNQSDPPSESTETPDPFADPSSPATVAVSDLGSHGFQSPDEVTEITDNVTSEVKAMLDDWAAAWSDKNVIQYLIHYSEDFNVPGRQSRTAWEALRRSRLIGPQNIEISIVYNNFTLQQPNIVDVKLNQQYQSNLYKDSTNKQFVVKKEGSTWRILSERSL